MSRPQPMRPQRPQPQQRRMLTRQSPARQQQSKRQERHLWWARIITDRGRSLHFEVAAVSRQEAQDAARVEADYLGHTRIVSCRIEPAHEPHRAEK